MVSVRVKSWQGPKAEETLVESAELTDVIDAVNSLDNKVTSEVSIEREDGAYLLVGGGDGRYHVTYGNDNDEFFTLRDESRQEGNEELVTGGQLGVFDARCVVNKSLALRAAETFHGSGAMDDGLTWLEE